MCCRCPLQTCLALDLWLSFIPKFSVFMVLCLRSKWQPISAIGPSYPLHLRGTIDYEHVQFAGPPLSKYLLPWRQESFCQFFSERVKKQMIRIIMVYQRAFFNRLENSTIPERAISQVQFGFKEGVGCAEAMCTILEAITHA